MSILDDAIREHLELKRAHGADEAELKRLEDEAFGPPQRPDGGDAFGEAPTEFLTAPAEVVEQAAEEVEGRRMPSIADLQEGPPREEVAEVPSEAPEAADAALEADGGPDVEEHPAMEHEAVAPPEERPAPAAEQPDGVHTTEEREAIADQPTQFFDVQAELDSTEASAEGPEVMTPAEDAPADDAPAAAAPPPAAPEPTAPEADSAELDVDDFFSEQRLSEELDQALEAPVSDRQEELPVHEDLPPPPVQQEEPTPTPDPAAAYTEEGTAIFDFEEEAEEEYEDEDDSDEENAYEPETGSHEDVLEDRPTFLEDEEDDVWFEQRPPKDFDLD